MKLWKMALFALICVLLSIQLLLPMAETSIKGVDRSRVKRPDGTVYQATLTIGTMSFDGTLQWLDRVTDEEVNQAIQEVLKDLKNDMNEPMREIDIGDLQRLVDNVNRAKQITQADVDAFKEKLKAVTGLDTAIDLADVLTGGKGKGLQEILEDYLRGEIDSAKGKIRDKILDVMAEGSSDMMETAGTAEKILNAVVAILDQMEKDQWRQEDRAAKANAFRKLQKFYEDVNDRIYRLVTSRDHGWQLKIEAMAEKNLTFFTIEGNHERWKAYMTFHKLEKTAADAQGPSGAYTGTAKLEVEYDLKAFDDGFAGYITKLWEQMAMPGSKTTLSESGENSSSKISRNLYDTEGISLDITIGAVGKQQITEYKVKPDYSGLKDEKEIHIKREFKVIQTGPKFNVTAEGNDAYSAENAELITENYASTSSGPGGTYPYAFKYDMKWDNIIWEQWNKEKTITIQAL